MTKAEIVADIANKTGIEKVAVQKTVEAFMEAIKGSMSNGENVYLRGFGSFIVKERAEKTTGITIRKYVTQSSGILESRMWDMDRLREDVSLQPWLFRTASNLAIDHLRKTKPGRTVSLEAKREETGLEPETTLTDDAPDDPHRQVLRQQLEEKLVTAMNQLPKRQRMAMTLRCLRELTMKEIAEILECKERTVGTTLFAARKKLMRDLEPLLADLIHAR